MRDSEFNEIKVTNEDNDLSFEFGHTQKTESTFYKENRNKIRDEINDNPASNGASKLIRKKQDERKDRFSRKDSTPSSGGSSGGNGGSSGGGGGSTGSAAASTEAAISSSTATVATVAGASLVSVVTLSTLVGINIYFNGKCNMKMLKPSPYSIAYQLDLSNINDDECVITLVNEDVEFSDSRTLIEGENTGEFVDLFPSTEYVMTVIDVTYDNYILYQESISTESGEATISYTVTFVSNGGSEVASQTIYENDIAFRPDNPTRDGYTFVDWCTDVELTEVYDFNTPVTGDLTLYAKWEEIITYTVSFDGNEAEGEMEPEQSIDGEDYIIPECSFVPSDGLEFAYWTMNDDEETQYQPGDEIVLTGDITLKAHWTTIMCTITFVANNGTDEVMEPVVLEYNTYFTMPDCEFSDPDESHMFAGWNIDDNPEVMKEASWYVHGDAVLTANWEECYIVTYENANIEDDPVTIKVPVSNPTHTTLETSDFTVPEGTHFYCWLNDTTPIMPGESIELSSNVTLTANFAPEEGFNVYFDTNGAEDDMTEYEDVIVAGETFSLPEITPMSPDISQRFAYWEYNGHNYEPGDEVVIHRETTFIAIWEANTEYQFQYQAGDGTGEFEPITVYDGQSYELLSELPDGFTAPTDTILVGWDVNGEIYEPGQVITINGDTSPIAQYRSTDPEFTSITFHAIDNTNNKLYVTLDYFDPLSTWSDFELILGGNDIPLTASTSLQEIDINAAEFDYSSLNSYVVSCFEAGNTTGAITLVEGKVNLSQFSTSGEYASATVLNAGTTSRAYWTDAGSSDSKIATRVVFNEYESDKTYYLRYVIYGNTAYRYTNALLPTNGVQVVSFTNGYSGNYLNLTTFELVSSSDGGENYEVVKDLGSTSINDIYNNSNLSSYLFGGYFDNDTLPTSSTSATNCKLNLVGRNISGLSNDLVLTLTFSFPEEDGGDIDSKNTYSLEVTLTTTDLENGYVIVDLTTLSNGGLDEDGFDNFISKLRRTAANVEITYYFDSLGDNQTLTLYSTHLFKCV